MQNLGNIYIWGSPFVMSRTDAQNGVDIIFNCYKFDVNCNFLQHVGDLGNVKADEQKRAQFRLESHDVKAS
jgi:hypothetical protein